VVGYDGAQNVRDEGRSVGRKKSNHEQTEETKQSRWGFRGKTVWDWMALLIVPLALVVIGLVFTMLQDARQQEIENQRAQQAQKIENERAEAEQELADQRAQDEALQAYLDQMSGLLLERDLRVADKDSEVSSLARARTVTVLQRLDANRNQTVIRFLKEARLTGSSIGLLAEADLRGAHLEGTDTDLKNADLSGAILRGADLSDVILIYADLSGANLNRAQGISNEALHQQAASLEGATMPNCQKYEDWLKSNEG
jgi:hypothetical protein